MSGRLRAGAPNEIAGTGTGWDRVNRFATLPSGNKRCCLSVPPRLHIPGMTGDAQDAEADRRPYYKVPLNLPHAGRIARRILPLLPGRVEPGGEEAVAARKTTTELIGILETCLEEGENPNQEVSAQLCDRGATLGRRLVDHIERGGFGHDRLGQCVRNFFECLELGREGADISLRAGENPRSMQRPF
jgi:hypothetical protein